MNGDVEMYGGSLKNLQSSSPYNQVKHFGKFPIVTPSTTTLPRVISPNHSRKCRSPRSLIRLNYIIYLPDYSNIF